MQDHQQVNELQVVSYNVHSCVGSDGRYSVERVAEALSGSDIVCLQEVEANHVVQQTRLWSSVHNHHQPQMIASALELPHVEFAPAVRSVTPSSAFRNKKRSLRESFKELHDCAEARHGEFGIAILSKHPIVEVKQHAYQRFGSKTLRNALACLVQLPNHSTVWIVTTHLGCHWGPEQKQQAQELVPFLDSLMEEGDASGVVLCGDFNSLSCFGALQTLKNQGGLIDVGQDAGCTFPAPGLIPLRKEPFLRLDYMFVKEREHQHDDDSSSLAVKSSFVMKNAGPASDHLPLCSVLQIR